MIKLKLGIMGLLLFLSGEKAIAQAKLTSTNRPAGNLKLFIEPSSTPVPGGKATLNVGLLNLESGAFMGNYQVKVVPYVFQNEKGRLSMTAPAVSLAKLTNQMAVDFVGQSTSTGGNIKRIDGTITPSNRKEGKVVLWFMAGKRKMIFHTVYHFVEK